MVKTRSVISRLGLDSKKHIKWAVIRGPDRHCLAMFEFQIHAKRYASEHHGTVMEIVK